MGAILAAEGKTDRAAAEYERALQLDPDLLAARHDLAVLESKTDTAQAIRYWEDNLRRNADFAPSRLSLSRALRELPGRLEDSADEYSKLLESRPNLIGARAEYADVLLRLGRQAAALAQLELAVQAEPVNFLFREKLGDLFSSQGDTRAGKQYGEALRLAPDRGSRRRIAAKIRAGVAKR
jgi:tetratricopeptide (TPR) repeat protein